MISTIESVGITVADMGRSIEFYTTVLACQKTSDLEVSGEDIDRLYNFSNARLRVVRMQLGNETIELIEFLTHKGRPIPPDSRSNDRWFQHLAIVVRDMDQAAQHLRQHGVTQISPTPQTLPAWNPVAGNIQSFYFKDLEGHDLELIHFPKDKGDPKWQNSTAALFLGIDHTAIAIASTDASRAFYCNQLGMKLQQESQNFGPEQERLSGISKVQVRISSLKAATGLGVELLEYEKPSPGRSMPVDTQANDLWFCQTTIVVEDLAAAIAEIRQSKIHQLKISSSKILSSLALGLNQVCLLQDPDGHTIRLVEKVIAQPPQLIEKNQGIA